MELAITLTVDAENPDVGDLRLSGGTLLLLSDLGPEVAQRITVRLNFFKGEWWLDRRQGTPWFQQILGQKAPDLGVIRAIFSRVILGTPGMATLDTLALGGPGANREGALVFDGRLANGQRFLSTAYGPFLVRVP